MEGKESGRRGEEYSNSKCAESSNAGSRYFPEFRDNVQGADDYPLESAPMGEGGILLPLPLILVVKNGIFGQCEPSGLHVIPPSALGRMVETGNSFWETIYLVGNAK